MHQELGVVENFLEDLSSLNLYKGITGYRKLPEADQDFLLTNLSADIMLQVTEIVERDYACPISKADHDSGMYIHKGFDAEDWVVDIRRRDTSIQRSIQKKIDKCIARSENDVLWLLIFSASAHLLTECCERGASKVSTALVTARDYLSSLDQVVFDKIWYSNQMTRPVQIWPYNKIL